MRRELEYVLDECLSQLNTGEVSLEEVLARYPEHEAELRPLLRTAMLVQQVPQVVPSPEATAAGRQRLLAAVAEKRREKAPARPGLLRRLEQRAAILVQPLMQPRRQPLRLAQAMAALLLIVSLIGAGAVGVAAGSLPDSPLYTIKRTTERIQLALTTSAEGKARLHMSYSEKRMEEARKLWEAGRGLSEAALQAMESEYSDALTAIGRVSEEEKLNLLTDFTHLTEKQQTTLEEIEPEVPPPDQETVEKALQTTGEYQGVATEALRKLKARPEPTPTDSVAPGAPNLPAAQAPTATPVLPTATPISVPTATPIPTPTPVPPTATPIPPPTEAPTITPTSEVEAPFQPTAEPTAMPTPTDQVEVPFQPTAEASPSPTPTTKPSPTPTSSPTPTATSSPTPTPVPTPTPTATPVPTPTPEPTITPTPEVEAPFQPAPSSSVTNCRVSDAPQGTGATEFPSGTQTIYIVFDYDYMSGEEVGIKVTDNIGNVLLEEVRTLSEDGTVSIPLSEGKEGFTAGPYLVNISYKNGGVIRTINWDVVE